MALARTFMQTYKLRLRRKRLLWRAFRKRHELTRVSRKTGSIKDNDILLFATLRNEMLRLPFFLKHYRRLGVAHFLFVDNGSDDGSTDYLAGQPDVSLWRSDASYKASRFGMDWLTALQWRYGSGHWTVTVDVDELLIYPASETHQLGALTRWLDSQNIPAMGALMLDLYPKGSVTQHTYQGGSGSDRGRSVVRRLWLLGTASGENGQPVASGRPACEAFLCPDTRARTDAEQDTAGSLAAFLCLCQFNAQCAPDPSQ